MEKVKILIVEDELIIAEHLKIMLEDMGYQVPAIFTSGKETLEKFNNGFADIIIMDIHLAGSMNGIDTSVEIRKFSTAPIIYITDNKDDNLRKKAIYETNTVHYISKPFSRMDISVAIDLAIKALKGHDLLLKEQNNSSRLINECIFVKGGQGFKKVMISDIILLKADGAYCSLTHRTTGKGEKESNDEDIVFSENLSFLEQKLTFAKELVRIHRSYIVNISCVTKIQDNRLWIDDREIPIGKNYKNEMKTRFHFI